MYAHSFKSISRGSSKPKPKLKPKLKDPISLIEELKANINSSLNEPILDTEITEPVIDHTKPVIDHTNKINEIKIRRSQSVDAMRLKKKINFADTTHQIHSKTLPSIEEETKVETPVQLQRCNSTTSTVTSHPIKSPRPLSRQATASAPKIFTQSAPKILPQSKPKILPSKPKILPQSKPTHAFLKKGSGCVQ